MREGKSERETGRNQSRDEEEKYIGLLPALTSGVYMYVGEFHLKKLHVQLYM